MLKGFEKSLVKTIRAARPNLKQSSIQTGSALQRNERNKGYAGVTL